MVYSITYPEIVELSDGTRVQVTKADWKNRQLVVETDKSEMEVRRMFKAEGFHAPLLEWPKKDRLGSGVVKRIGDWQIHFRFFKHDDHIQIDGEVEISSAFLEHLKHGWIPALKECMDAIGRHFGKYWIYHKGYGKYVTGFVNESILELSDPEFKTSTVAVVAITFVGALGGAYLAKKG